MNKRIKKNKKSRFEGLSLETLNQEVAKVTNQHLEANKNTDNLLEKGRSEVMKSSNIDEKFSVLAPSKEVKNTSKKAKGRPKSSNRKPLNTAIEPKNRQRLEFLAILNGGSLADQLNNILNRYFTEIEKVDDLIDIFEKQKEERQ